MISPGAPSGALLQRGAAQPHLLRGVNHNRHKQRSAALTGRTRWGTVTLMNTTTKRAASKANNVAVLEGAWKLVMASLTGAKDPSEVERLRGELAGIEAQMKRMQG